MKRHGDTNPIFNSDFFEDRESKAVGTVLRTVKPVLKFVNNQVRLGFNVGARGNGMDLPRWPDDLLVEVIS